MKDLWLFVFSQCNFVKDSKHSWIIYGTDLSNQLNSSLWTINDTIKNSLGQPCASFLCTMYACSTIMYYLNSCMWLWKYTLENECSNPKSSQAALQLNKRSETSILIQIYEFKPFYLCFSGTDENANKISIYQSPFTAQLKNFKLE